MKRCCLNLAGFKTSFLLYTVSVEHIASFMCLNDIWISFTNFNDVCHEICHEWSRPEIDIPVVRLGNCLCQRMRFISEHCRVFISHKSNSCILCGGWMTAPSIHTWVIPIFVHGTFCYLFMEYCIWVRKWLSRRFGSSAQVLCRRHCICNSVLSS